MPPKKTLKALKAEEKKKNTAKAEDIISNLVRETAKARRHSTDKSKKSNKGKPERAIATQSKKKNSEKAKIVVSEPVPSTQSVSTDLDMVSITNDVVTPITNNIVVPTATEVVVSMDTNFDSTKDGVVSTVDRSRDKSISTLQRTKFGSTSNSKVSKASVSKPGKTGDYQYEIDCQKVADSIDVADLQRHLEKHLKVNGKKNNLDGTISIHCKGDKVVIKSNTFLPKKSLRFLSKKFLKKNWNIRVVSKNVHSYDYKYVGTL